MTVTNPGETSETVQGSSDSRFTAARKYAGLRTDEPAPIEASPHSEVRSPQQFYSDTLGQLEDWASKSGSTLGRNELLERLRGRVEVTAGTESITERFLRHQTAPEGMADDEQAAWAATRDAAEASAELRAQAGIHNALRALNEHLGNLTHASEAILFERPGFDASVAGAVAWELDTLLDARPQDAESELFQHIDPEAGTTIRTEVSYLNTAVPGLRLRQELEYTLSEGHQPQNPLTIRLVGEFEPATPAPYADGH